MTIADATKLLTKCIKQAIIMMNEVLEYPFDRANKLYCQQNKLN